MKKDFMADVMNELDDDLIQETAKHRSKPNFTHKNWIRPTVIAATFAIIAGVLIGKFGFPLLAQNNESMVLEKKDSHASSSQEGLQEENVTMDNLEVPSLLISVRCWSEDGFSGTVTDTVDTKAVPVGSEVFVKTDEETEFINMPDELVRIDMMMLQGDLCKEDQIVLRVMFHTTDMDNSSVSYSDNEKIHYLYAEQVWLAEVQTDKGE